MGKGFIVPVYSGFSSRKNPDRSLRGPGWPPQFFNSVAARQLNQKQLMNYSAFKLHAQEIRISVTEWVSILRNFETVAAQ